MSNERKLGPGRATRARIQNVSVSATEFTAALWRYPGKGGWTFVTVPMKHAPLVTHGWGRTPVRATVDGHEWATSVWRGKDGKTLLAVPRQARGSKGEGDRVSVRLDGR